MSRELNQKALGERVSFRSSGNEFSLADAHTPRSPQGIVQTKTEVERFTHSECMCAVGVIVVVVVVVVVAAVGRDQALSICPVCNVAS